MSAKVYFLNDKVQIKVDINKLWIKTGYIYKMKVIERT